MGQSSRHWIQSETKVETTKVAVRDRYSHDSQISVQRRTLSTKLFPVDFHSKRTPINWNSGLRVVGPGINVNTHWDVGVPLLPGEGDDSREPGWTDWVLDPLTICC